MFFSHIVDLRVSSLWAQAKMIVVPKQDHIHVHSKPKHKIGIDVIFLLCFNDVFYFILLL